MKVSEHSLQVACFNYFRYVYPSLKLNFYAVPNGGYRAYKTACFLKAEGVLSGVPDTFLAVPRKGFHGLYIEFKTKTGLTDNQKEVIKALEAQGYLVAIIRTVDDFIKTIESYLND